MVPQDPFGGLIEGVLQGHAIATQLRHQAMQEEAFQRAKVRENQENQLRDMETQIRMAQFGRPVTGDNMVEQSFEVPRPSGGVPGLPDTSQTIRFARPVDKSRLLKSTLSDGRTIQAEGYTADERAQRELQAAIGQKRAEAFSTADIADQVRQYNLQRRGIEAPDILVRNRLARPGELLLPEELARMIPEAQKISSPDLKDVAPGASLVQVPKPDVGAGNPFGSAPMMGQEEPALNPPLPGENPLATAAAPGQQARTDFVSRAQQPRGPQVLLTVPEKPTNKTEAELSWMAHSHPNPLVRAQADAALKRLDQSKIASRPVNTFVAPTSNPSQGPPTVEQVPATFRGQVGRILNDLAPMPPAGRNNPTNQALRYWVSAINPNYDETNFPARNKLIQGYTSGSQSKEISGINTALGHVATLGDAIDALHNSNLQLLNGIANTIGVQTGGDAVTTFKAIVHKVAPELNRAYVGGVGAQGEIKDQESDFDPKLGDKQLRSNVGITVHLLRSKIGSLEKQYKTTVKKDDFGQRFLTDEAQAAVDKYSPKAAQAAAPLPGTLSQSDIGKVYLNREGKPVKITAVNPANPKQFKFEAQ